MPGGVGGVASRDVPLSRSILKMKSQAFKAPDPKSLQSKFPFARKIESPIKALRVLRERLTRLDPIRGPDLGISKKAKPCGNFPWK